MGESCSKMDTTATKAEETKKKDANHSSIPQIPDTTSDGRQAKRKRNSLTQSIRRFTEGAFGNGAPLSPRRASNYDVTSEFAKYNLEEAKANRKTPLGVAGMRNMGNTCFMNSALQCLSATIPLTDYFLGYDYKSEINRYNFLGTKGKLVTAYAELVKQLWLGKNAVIKPTKFKSELEAFSPQFSGSHQHDAQEFLAYLLDGIHEDLNRIQKKPYVEDRDCDGNNDERDAIEAWKNYLKRDKSLVVDIFQGQLRNTMKCLKCGHKNIRFEPFMYLSVPLQSQRRTKCPPTLQECLDLYLKEEKLTGDNQWYCSECKKHRYILVRGEIMIAAFHCGFSPDFLSDEHFRDATKKTDIWILPPILIVHLKRFRANEFGQVASKNNSHIKYDVTGWDLSRIQKTKTKDVPIYDLYAVSNHRGDLGGGHYTAYTLNRFTENWWEFNDSQYSEIDESMIEHNSSSAYLLFYNRSMGGTRSLHDSNGTMLIRRQSISRPDLWPHSQVQHHAFRSFTRRSNRLMGLPPDPSASH